MQEDTDGDGFGDACETCDEVWNPDQQPDTDGDGWGNGCDCRHFDPLTYPGAPEMNDGLDNSCDGLVDETSAESAFTDAEIYAWPPQSGATEYEVARADSPEFAPGCFTRIVGTSYPDEEVPPLGGAFYYLNRSHAPNVGSWGADSAGQERVVPCAGD